MGKILSRSRFTLGSLWAVFGFWTLSGFAPTASAETTGIDPVHFSMALGVLMILAMLAFELWLFWKAWKNRLPEEEPEAVNPSPRPVLTARAPVPPTRPPLPRKKTSKQREKALV
jgi:hypothetical protein